jgi:hypothetical protein
MGAAEHVQRWTTSLKCSGPKTWTAWSAAIAVPMAFVPAPDSLQSGEVHVIGGAQPQARAALDHQEQALGIGDDDQVVGLFGDRRQARVDQRRRPGQRMFLPQHLRLVLVGDDRRELVAGGIDPRGERAPPGRDDRLPDVVGIAVALIRLVADRIDEALPREAQLLGSQQRRRSGVDGQPRLGAHLPPVPGDVVATGRDRKPAPTDEATGPPFRGQSALR